MFVDELRWEETEGTKHDKIHVLKLNNDEWEQVGLFLGLLSVCILYDLVIQYHQQKSTMFTL